MGYCETTDVARLNPQRVYTDTSTVKLADIAAWIVDISAEIDGVLSEFGFTIPITGTKSLARLRLTTALGVAAIAEFSLFMGSDRNMSSHGEVLKGQYEDRMKQIIAWCKGKEGIALDDAPRDTEIKTGLSISTIEIRPGGTEEDREIFTSVAIEDFVQDYKQKEEDEETFAAGTDDS